MKLSASEIFRRIGAEPTLCNDNRTVEILLTDSRDLIFPDRTMFFALETSSADGHAFIPELYNRGVREFVVSSAYHRPERMADANFCCVDFPLDALQRLGESVRDDFPGLVSVGITGSRGKTVVKELLYDMLRPYLQVVRSPRSYNSQIGVPLSLWELCHDTKVGICEAGISRCDEMPRIARIIRPNIGIFTSLTDEHADGFSSLEEKAREKAQLFVHTHVVFVPVGNGLIINAVREANASAEIVEVEGDNRKMASTVARYILASQGLTNVEPQRLGACPITRIEVHEALKNCLIIFDAFTPDLRSLTDAIGFMNRRATSGRTSTVILGDFVENVGCDASAVYYQAAQVLVAAGVKKLYGVGQRISECADAFISAGLDCRFSKDADEFCNAFSISDFEDELILIKGTPSAGFEAIKSHLQAPRHETVLEVNLNAIVHNYNYFKSLLPPGMGLVAMVKADAYGTGALEVSKTLQAQGAAYLAVAVVDEGIALRRAGITMPIIVMNPMGTNYKALFDNKLEPSVFSMRELDLLLTNAERYDVTNYPVHIKLDTGMHRLGFLEDELPGLVDRLNAQSRLRVASVFSHLATADCLDKDAYTEMQMQTYDRGSRYLCNRLPAGVKRHLLNTAGILRYNDFPTDMARLGIGLYGVSPLSDTESASKLQNVASLLTTIISLRTWQPGAAIGYGGWGRIERPSVIATIPIGYADGFNRHLGRGRAWVLVNGVKCPTVGNICMDQCMIDVTDANASIGDNVTIFGPGAPLQRLADTLDTIPYEVLTSISPRVKRIYFRE